MYSKIEIAKIVQESIINSNKDYLPAISGGLCLETLGISKRHPADIDINVYSVDLHNKKIKPLILQNIEKATGGKIVIKNSHYYKYINYLREKSLFMLEINNQKFKIDLTYYNNKPFSKLLIHNEVLFENITLQAICKAIAVNSLTLRRKYHDFTDLYCILNSSYFKTDEIEIILNNSKFKRYLRLRSLNRLEWLSVITAIPFLRVSNPAKYVHPSHQVFGINFLDAVQSTFEFSKKILHPALPFIRKNSFSSWLIKLKI